ncbi:MAG: hypothetical protein EOO13_10925 [Chitinophagaceae bacterium]|nr:MAG: hypothetical protein EOO13_10925 [Chitinophagaceae bacterium]
MSLFYKKTTFYILLVATIGMIVAMFIQGRPLTLPGTPAGIVSLELAATDANVQAVLETWKEAGNTDAELIQVAINNTRLDFLFLLCYALFLFTVAKQISRFYAHKKMFNVVAWMAILSAVLDIIENMGMLNSLNGEGNDAIAFATAAAAYFKWIAVILVIVFLLLAVLHKLVFKQNRQPLN